MLKRNGELCKYTVPDFIGRLTPAEFDTYNEAFGAIQDEFNALTKIKDGLKEISANPGVSMIPDGHSEESVVVPNIHSSGESRLNVRSYLLKLNYSDVLLCERMTNEGKQFAVVERYKNGSAYAQANGNVRVLLVNNDPQQAVEDYVGQAEHTLRFMASNMVARAQTIVWERFANQSPSRVIRAISERCSKAVGEAQNEIQERILERRMLKEKSIGRWQSVGRGV
jgi:hypothetical protein